MVAMNEMREAETETGGQRERPVRKVWHAPQLIISGLASTNAQGNGGHDAAPSAPSQS